jgi:predicted metal-dependent HD superfamily phosphohydrolase
MTCSAGGGPGAGGVDDLHHDWQELLAPRTGSSRIAVVGQALIGSWADPSRHYHDVAHLRDALAGVHELAAHAPGAGQIDAQQPVWCELG